MPCPDLAELPTAASGKPSWPWTEGSLPLPESMPSLGEVEGVRDWPWPRVSIVTPSYNQGLFLEETIRSVLLQGYPNLEYIIMDGGSTDDSVETIRKYEPWLTYWATESDRGQAHAINKGWARATGDVFSWLNSDDTLAPGGLATAVESLYADPDTEFVYGNADLIDAESRVIGTFRGRPFAPEFILLRGRNPIPQQGFVMKRSLLKRVGWLDESLDFLMDFDFWARMALEGVRAVYLDCVLANFRQHPQAKTSTQHKTFIQERDRVFEKIYTSSELPARYEEQRDRAKSLFDLHTAYIAYRAEDAKLARAYAWRHITNAGLRSAVLGYYLLLFSFGGRWGMRAARQLQLLGTRLAKPS